MKKDWTEEQLLYYYLGIEHSDYPRIFWEIMVPDMAGCSTLLDIGCGPGAFALKAAASGFSVQAVDLNQNRLEALKKRKKALNLRNIKTILGDWLEIQVEESDITICAYSFGGTISTPEGIKKIIAQTRKIAFLITPYKRAKTEFLSAELYRKSGMAPPVFSGDYRDLLRLFEGLQEKVKYEIITYDFGMPLAGRAKINDCAVYLADKLGLPSVALVQKHLQNIVMEKNGGFWVPNPRKSALITWKK